MRLIRSPMKSTKVGLVNNMTGLVKMAVPTDCFRDNFEFSTSNKLDHKSTGRLPATFLCLYFINNNNEASWRLFSAEH